MKPKTAIHRLRRAGMSQARIAAACGCTPSAISLIRTGKRKQPGYELANKLVALARGLNT